jgi:hypothetical protein
LIEWCPAAGSETANVSPPDGLLRCGLPASICLIADLLPSGPVALALEVPPAVNIEDREAPDLALLVMTVLPQVLDIGSVAVKPSDRALD